MKNITKTDVSLTEVEKYVMTLDPQIQKLYRDSYDNLLGYRDTLDDEFQILAEINRMFWGYAIRYYLGDNFDLSDK